MTIDGNELGPPAPPEPAPPPPLCCQMDFSLYERSVPLARRMAARALAEWGQAADDVAAVVLVVGELAANAVRHAHVPAEPFTVALTMIGPACLVEVSDPLDDLPQEAKPASDDERGRGLLIVKALAAELGHWRRPGGGKTVWAALPLASAEPGTRRVCGERASLPERLVPTALAFAPHVPAEPADVERDLRCTLEAHAFGDHHAFVRELDGVDTGSVWTRWPRGHLPTTVFVLPDCPAARPEGDDPPEPCCEFADHPGAHTWQTTDHPGRAAARTRRLAVGAGSQATA